MQKLIANDKVYETFAAWIGGGRLSHAVLLEGPSGCGKSTLAKQLAQGVLCEGAGGEPCLECRHCVKMERGVHPDFLVYEGDGRSRSFHIETVRDIKAKAGMFPNEADMKVFLLKNVQEMTVQAQNALLKLLEEPPGSAMFILTCDNKSVMLETILSRVVSLALSLPSVEGCAALLPSITPGLDRQAYENAAESSGGNVGRALDLLGDEGPGAQGAAVLLWEGIRSGDGPAALSLLAGYDRDRKGFAAFLEAFRRILEGLVLSGRSGVSSLRLLEIVAIIDEIGLSNAGNGNISLLGGVLYARAAAALNK